MCVCVYWERTRWNARYAPWHSRVGILKSKNAVWTAYEQFTNIISKWLKLYNQFRNIKEDIYHRLFSNHLLFDFIVASKQRQISSLVRKYIWLPDRKWRRVSRYFRNHSVLFINRYKIIQCTVHLVFTEIMWQQEFTSQHSHASTEWYTLLANCWKRKPYSLN